MKKMYAFLMSLLLLTGSTITAYAEEGEAPPTPEPASIEAVAPEVAVAQPAEQPTVEQPILIPTAPEGAVPALIVVHRVSCLADVYDKDNLLIRTLVVSTGREGHRTPLGTFSIYEHTTSSGYHLMVDSTYGRWCMRFKKGGYMFHSVCYAKSGDAEPIPEEVAALGTSVSRGCVRLSVTDAEWLYNATPKGCAVQVLDD